MLSTVPAVVFFPSFFFYLSTRKAWILFYPQIFRHLLKAVVGGAEVGGAEVGGAEIGAEAEVGAGAIFV